MSDHTIYANELFRSLVESTFDREDALYLTGMVLCSLLTDPEEAE